MPNLGIIAVNEPLRLKTKKKFVGPTGSFYSKKNDAKI
jgi:hypothetical protein